MEIHKDRYGVKHCIIEAHYRKLLNLDPKTEGYTHLKQFFNNWELHIRGFEAQNRKNEEFGDLTLFPIDKFSGDLRRCLARAHRNQHGHSMTSFKRELQVMEVKNQRSKLNGKLIPSTAAG